MNEQLLSPPESYPIPHTGLRNHEHTAYIGESTEEKKEFLVVTRNSLEILSSILTSEVEPKPIKVTLLSPPFGGNTSLSCKVLIQCDPLPFVSSTSSIPVIL